MEVTEATIDADGRMNIKIRAEVPPGVDLGTKKRQSQQYRVRIEDDEGALYFYTPESAAALVHALRSEQVMAWAEENFPDYEGDHWVRIEV